jgi:asparagine synthase (glutamine-hydrolysing)
MLSGDEMLSRLDEAVTALDQPSIDGINTYFVSWAARQAGLKVALSGLGGDEVFGGYSTFRWGPRFERLTAFGNMFPSSLRGLMASALTGTGVNSGPSDARRKLAAVWRNPDALPHPYFFSRILFTPAQVTGLMNGAGNHAGGERLWWDWLADGAEQARGLDSFNSVSLLETRSYLVSTLLRDTDSMSMANSLEVRVPFLDHPLVELVARLPEQMKRRRGIPKALLVETLRDLLPAEVVNQTKRGFTFPWQQWLRGKLYDRMRHGLTETAGALRPWLDPQITSAVWQDFLAGRTSWARPWSLYVVSQWARRHLDGA